MKKAKFIVLTCVAAAAAAFTAFSASAAEDIAIDETNFPDEAFRGYISENYDTDKNGALSAQEIENAEELLIEDSVYDEDDNLITQQLDLTGINYLKKLKVIKILSRNVINADISGIEALTKIVFGCENVSGLVLGDMSAMETLSIDRSDLTELSLVDCPALVSCFLTDNEKLAKLEIKNAPSLDGCYIFGSDLTEFSIVDFPALTVCDVRGNPKLAKLEIKNAPNLMAVVCCDNVLVSLKIENCDMLFALECANNRLIKLDITNCPMIDRLHCSGNMIAQLDISPFQGIIDGMKNFDGMSGDEPPLIVDSGTKVIGYDMSESDSSESSESAVESSASSKPQEKEKNSNTTLLVVMLAAIVIAGIAAAVIVAMARGGKEK